DGTRIVTASEDTTARVWDAASGKAIAELRGHKYSVTSASFSPNGARIVTASYDSVRIWDAASGKPIGEPLRGKLISKTLRGRDGKSALFSPDGTRIVTASHDFFDDHRALIWDAASGKPIGEPLSGHEGEVYRAAFSPDGTRIVTVSEDKTARVWDAANGKAIGAPLRGHEMKVFCAPFSPDGTRIVTASKDKTARACDAANA